jgi:iron complex transport system ATP-binding protein
MESAIDIRGLHFFYGKKKILDNVNCAFPGGQFSVLLGANGSGKSTLFKIIAGLLPGYEGAITVYGSNAARLRFKERASLIGFLPQFHRTVFPFSVEEILLTGRAAFSGFSPVKADRMRLEQIMEELELEGLREAPFTLLSGGEQQMVMIGRLLMQNPRIIVMDEPTNHLDVYYQHRLMYKLKQYTTKGVTVICIMHNPTLAYQYADGVYFMHQRTVLSPALTSIPDLHLLRSIYGTEFRHIEQEDLNIVLPVQA